MCRNKPEHSWPQSQGLSAFYANGSISITYCNNCLAVKVVQTVDQKDGMGGWKKESKETLVEPPQGF
jgi:hypothetical protein